MLMAIIFIFGGIFPMHFKEEQSVIKKISEEKINEEAYFNLVKSFAENKNENDDALVNISLTYLSDEHIINIAKNYINDPKKQSAIMNLVKSRRDLLEKESMKMGQKLLSILEYFGSAVATAFSTSKSY